MEAFAGFLQKNPYVIIGLFVITVIGAIASWPQFLAIVRKQVTVPGWVILLFITFWAVTYFIDKGDGLPHKFEDYEKVVGKNFGVETIEIEGKSFERCQFYGTQLVYSGRTGFSLIESGFHGTPIAFTGPAQNTIAFLTLMYKSPDSRVYVDSLFDYVRRDAMPTRVLPSNK